MPMIAESFQPMIAESLESQLPIDFNANSFEQSDIVYVRKEI